MLQTHYPPKVTSRDISFVNFCVICLFSLYLRSNAEEVQAIKNVNARPSGKCDKMNLQVEYVAFMPSCLMRNSVLWCFVCISDLYPTNDS